MEACCVKAISMWVLCEGWVSKLCVMQCATAGLWRRAAELGCSGFAILGAAWAQRVGVRICVCVCVCVWLQVGGPSAPQEPEPVQLFRTRADGTLVPISDGAGLDFARRKGVVAIGADAQAK
jgi:hypothetical protein